MFLETHDLAMGDSCEVVLALDAPTSSYDLVSMLRVELPHLFTLELGANPELDDVRPIADGQFAVTIAWPRPIVLVRSALADGGRIAALQELTTSVFAPA